MLKGLLKFLFKPGERAVAAPMTETIPPEWLKQARQEDGYYFLGSLTDEEAQAFAEKLRLKPGQSYVYERPDGSRRWVQRGQNMQQLPKDDTLVKGAEIMRGLAAGGMVTKASSSKNSVVSVLKKPRVAKVADDFSGEALTDLMK